MERKGRQIIGGEYESVSPEEKNIEDTFAELKSKGELPEGVRDVQDYAEYAAEKEAHEKEAEPKISEESKGRLKEMMSSLEGLRLLSDRGVERRDDLRMLSDEVVGDLYSEWEKDRRRERDQEDPYWRENERGYKENGAYNWFDMYPRQEGEGIGEYGKRIHENSEYAKMALEDAEKAEAAKAAAEAERAVIEAAEAYAKSKIGKYEAHLRRKQEQGEYKPEEVEVLLEKARKKFEAQELAGETAANLGDEDVPVAESETGESETAESEPEVPLTGQEEVADDAAEAPAEGFAAEAEKKEETEAQKRLREMLGDRAGMDFLAENGVENADDWRRLSDGQREDLYSRWEIKKIFRYEGRPRGAGSVNGEGERNGSRQEKPLQRVIDLIRENEEEQSKGGEETRDQLDGTEDNSGEGGEQSERDRRYDEDWEKLSFGEKKKYELGGKLPQDFEFTKWMYDEGHIAGREKDGQYNFRRLNKVLKKKWKEMSSEVRKRVKAEAVANVDAKERDIWGDWLARKFGKYNKAGAYEDWWKGMNEERRASILSGEFEVKNPFAAAWVEKNFGAESEKAESEEQAGEGERADWAETKARADEMRRMKVAEFMKNYRGPENQPPVNEEKEAS